MSKLRSGKIRHCVLAAISNTMDMRDITTLANPDVVGQIRMNVQGTESAKLKEGSEGLKQFVSAE